MLIPYATVRKRSRIPWVTLGIVGTNFLVYACLLTLDPSDFGELARRWGSQGLAPEGLYKSLTAIWLHDPRSFLHMHLIGNMWALIVFGPQVEDAMGHVLYGGYYLIGGIASCLTHATISQLAGFSNGPPMVGASGAVLCVLGVFAVRFYSTPVKTVVFLVPGVRLPAVIFLAIYVGFDVRAGIAGSFGERTVSGVAHWAHIGGFACGALAGLLHGVVGHAKREYLLERPIESPEDRRSRLNPLRQLVLRDPSDAEARLRLATLLDADDDTLPQAAGHYREAIQHLLREQRAERVLGAYDALREGGHGMDLLPPRPAIAVASALEQAERERDALELLLDVSGRDDLDDTELEHSLIGVAELGRSVGNLLAVEAALSRLMSELPFSPSVGWAKQGLDELHSGH